LFSVKHEVQVVAEEQVLQIGLHVLHLAVPSSYKPGAQSQFCYNFLFGSEQALHTPLTWQVVHLAGHGEQPPLV